MIISVLVELSNKNIDKTFDYLVPSFLTEKIKIGLRVTVPFGSQTLEGFVLSIKKDNNIDKELKEIIDVVDDEVILNNELLELGKYISKTTLSTLISSYQVMLPKALKASNGTNINKKLDKYIKLNNDIDLNSHKFNEKQQKIIDILLKEKDVLKDNLKLISPSSVSTLLSKNIIIETNKEHYRLESDIVLKDKYPLTEEQSIVVKEILDNDNYSSTYLLHGVTGSGKTEVYMEIIEEELKKGRDSIVLVPEISLTEQIVSRFQSRFGSNVAILHSRLSDGERYDEYRKIKRGEVNIVIGARSAIFAPLKNIGVIIIDEEHTGSYKQDNNPKYSAIDVAIERSKKHKCPVVLGSATPTLESYARAKKGVYKLLELNHRVNKKELPDVKIVDIGKEMKKGNHYFSKELIESINNCLSNNEQIILLLNRRGYSSFISCSSCGEVIKCPNCDITLTYHKTSNMLRCHYCGYGTKVADKCPNCNEESLTNIGTGTEKIEEEINKLFTNAKVVRMDFDTTSKKGSHDKIIKDFENHKYDILLGTQMIAKGLDFPNVTLVGVINADTSLNIPDFRSSENTFQLLDQVSGRSGRGELPGKVIIQTYNPDHYAIKYVQDHDYIGFYNQEMAIRKQLNYPPYYYLVSIKVMSKEYDLARDTSNQVSNYLKDNLLNTKILGPTVANVFKVNNIYRFQIILKYKKEEKLYEQLNKLIEHYKANSKIKIDIDFNPNHI